MNNILSYFALTLLVLKSSFSAVTSLDDMVTQHVVILVSTVTRILILTNLFEFRSRSVQKQKTKKNTTHVSKCEGAITLIFRQNEVTLARRPYHVMLKRNKPKNFVFFSCMFFFFSMKGVIKVGYGSVNPLTARQTFHLKDVQMLGL